METFIYTDLKLASLNKDKSKIPTLGPYAAALSYIVMNAHKSRVDQNPDLRRKYKNLIVYRGIKM